MADWKPFAIQRLKAYEARKAAIENIPEQIKALELQYTSVRAARTDGEPVRGGTNRREDMLINNIEMRNELTSNLAIAQKEVEITERGLAVLSDEERRILHRFFIQRTAGHVTRLCDELVIEKSELYRRKETALRKFTMAANGVVDL